MGPGIEFCKLCGLLPVASKDTGGDGAQQLSRAGSLGSVDLSLIPAPIQHL